MRRNSAHCSWLPPRRCAVSTISSAITLGLLGQSLGWSQQREVSNKHIKHTIEFLLCRGRTGSHWCQDQHWPWIGYLHLCASAGSSHQQTSPHRWTCHRFHRLWWNHLPVKKIAQISSTIKKISSAKVYEWWTDFHWMNPTTHARALLVYREALRKYNATILILRVHIYFPFAQ